MTGFLSSVTATRRQSHGCVPLFATNPTTPAPGFMLMRFLRKNTQGWGLVPGEPTGNTGLNARRGEGLEV